MKISTPNIDYSKPMLFCMAGNMCSPIVFDKIRMPDCMQKVYINYSEGPGPWDVETLGWKLVELVDSFNNVPVILAGYSAGGVIAISAVSKAPDKFAGLVLSNTGPCSIGHGKPGFAQELKERFNDEPFIRDFLRSCFSKPIPKELEDRLWEYTREISEDAGYEVSASLRQEDYRESLKKFKNPTAVIHGRLDTRRGLDSVQRIRDSLLQAKVTLLETGHTPMWEDPSGYQNALYQLFAECGII